MGPTGGYLLGFVVAAALVGWLADRGRLSGRVLNHPAIYVLSLGTIAGGLAGGVMMIRLGINRSLWVFGFLQAASTACFALLARAGDSIPLLSFVIAFENLSSGMGTAAYAAFMASITNKKFTATQYALLTSLMGVPRVLASAPTGFLAKNVGWEIFFIACALVAIPGMLLLLKFAPWNSDVGVKAEAV